MFCSVGSLIGRRSDGPNPSGARVAARSCSAAEFGLAPTRARSMCTYNTYMPNKTISVPDDVVPIIESLRMPFSRWVTDQLRRHAAQSTMSFADQLKADAVLAAPRRLAPEDALLVGERMERSAPW